MSVDSGGETVAREKARGNSSGHPESVGWGEGGDSGGKVEIDDINLFFQPGSSLCFLYLSMHIDG